ncbi:FkbM family methyltransferase [Marinoscillum sp.]|uniref:FkbM family methyltransferase n=1 Tax=Marinoscillum sp. TaxID=2024838 RepID=UPI003BAA25F4
MNFWAKFRALHRFWRYRLSSEKDSLTFLHSLSLKNTLTMDIGANKGAYSFWLSKAVGTGGEVWAFEPQPELGIYLEQIRQDFHLHNLRVFNHALSKNSGALKLDRKHAGHGGARVSAEGQLSVPSITLDSLLPEVERPISFLKCDVEGHELAVVEGGKMLLNQHQPILQLEIHHEAMLKGKVIHFLEELGYTGHFMQHGKLYPISLFDQFDYPRSDTHRNYLFFPSES